MDERGLREVFSRMGAVSFARVLRDPDTQRSKGYGFVGLVVVDSDPVSQEVVADGRKLVVRNYEAREYREARQAQARERQAQAA